MTNNLLEIFEKSRGVVIILFVLQRLESTLVFAFKVLLCDAIITNSGRNLLTVDTNLLHIALFFHVLA